MPVDLSCCNVIEHAAVQPLCLTPAVSSGPSAGLMEQLIGSPDLFVMQVEMDVYTALKKVMTD